LSLTADQRLRSLITEPIDPAANRQEGTVDQIGNLLGARSLR
jgi:hypothetical protein